MPKGINWESCIGRRLRLRDLHVLFAVVQSGSMIKAATQLGVSQPVVPEAIADLEATIGVRLLDRSPRGVAPTLYGQALLDRSQAAFDELRQGIKDIEFLADPTLGEVRIGCSESLTAGVLAPIIDQLSRRTPRVRFQVTQINTLNTRLEFPELRDRKLDVILARVVESFGEFEYAEDLNVESCSTTICWWSPGHEVRGLPAADRSAELAEAPWIPPANSWNSLRVEEAFAAIGMKMPDVAVNTFSVALRSHLLATGRFVAAIPASTQRANASRAPEVLPVKLPNKPWPVAMITLKNRTLSPAVQHFLEDARAAANTMPRGQVRKRKIQ